MKNDQDFRTAFASMDPRAVISREELALLLCRSPAAVSLMAHRGKLPRRAFPSERKACWFVGTCVIGFVKWQAADLQPVQTKTRLSAALAARANLWTD
ncbi:hypothetical protein CJO76_10945 [Ralstonia solanacearum]|uniref:hypothetical protein n=1 Tax=Ralstonia solanacearum TaxID=305 RepID=UPI000E574571|nr:hypothetical protein [Ralstonia solanacearum]AXV77437.1 hypothetical protein CJO76_10945 [Ralstonia solanacearum]